jgi:hypothetical protein
MNRFTNASEIEEAQRRLAALLDLRGLWLCTERPRGATTELQRGDWELRAQHGALHFSLWGEAGSRVWRVSGWEERGELLCLEATRRMGAERVRLELVPRASAGAAKAVVAAARRAACERLAALAAGSAAGAQVESARLSRGARRGEPGRYARILLRTARGSVAATAPVVELGREEADAFLSSALLWFERLSERPRGNAPRKLFLVAPRALSEATGERLALLSESLRRSITLYETDAVGAILTQASAPELSELLSRTPPLTRPAAAVPSGLASRIVALAPEACEVVRARRGETLRFRGLPFARVRRVMGREQAWFGIEGARQRRLVDRESWPELLKLVDELVVHRRADASDRRHAMYRALPEAWLESILRRDITRLDPGLIVSPLHAQFRASHDRGEAVARPVDLLALRRDGRLVVVELKVSEDAAHALQGADYWRRVELHRRCGHVERARLFGDAVISDEPPLVYLVAPLLRFHRDFDRLARVIRPEIEMYRFDLNEDWRAGVRVARRTRIAGG